MILNSLYKKVRRKFTVDKIPTMSDLGKKVTFGKNSYDLIKSLIKFKNTSQSDVLEFIQSIGFEKMDDLYRLKELDEVKHYCYVYISNFKEISIIASPGHRIVKVNLGEFSKDYKTKIVDAIIKELGFTPKSFTNFVREEKIKTLLK